MKKSCLSITVATLTAVVMLTSADAQIAMNKKIPEAGFNVSGYSATKTIDATKVNVHALKDFNARFTATNAPAWYETEKGFIAEVSSSEQQTLVAYQKNGKWVYTINKYSEVKLSPQVRALVKGTYYDYTILDVQEIKVPDNENNIFLIYLQDATSLKTIRVCNGEMTVIGDYQRG